MLVLVPLIWASIAFAAPSRLNVTGAVTLPENHGNSNLTRPSLCAPAPPGSILIDIAPLDNLQVRLSGYFSFGHPLLCIDIDDASTGMRIMQVLEDAQTAYHAISVVLERHERNISGDIHAQLFQIGGLPTLWMTLEGIFGRRPMRISFWCQRDDVCRPIPGGGPWAARQVVKKDDGFQSKHKLSIAQA